MKTLFAASFAALFAISGISGWTGSSAQAQDRQTTTTLGTAKLRETTSAVAEFQYKFDNYGYGATFERPYYLIQIEYARVGSGHHGGYGGTHGGGQGYRYVWVTIAETDDLEEAEFIYSLFELAQDLGVLHEVAPKYPNLDFPRRVQMITEYREYEPELFAD